MNFQLAEPTVSLHCEIFPSDWVGYELFNHQNLHHHVCILCVRVLSKGERDLS